MIGKEGDKKESLARFSITSYKKLMTINTLSSKYKKYSKIFKELEEGLSLLKHLEDDYEIVLNEPEKLKIGLIYVINEVESKTLQAYIKKNL